MPQIILCLLIGGFCLLIGAFRGLNALAKWLAKVLKFKSLFMQWSEGYYDVDNTIQHILCPAFL